MKTEKLCPITVDTSCLTYRKAKKTACVKAKLIDLIVTDSKGFEILLIKTLEGIQELQKGSMVCIGVNTDDPWQQDQDKLFKKYKVIGQDSNGWLMCEPLPTSEVNIYEVTDEYMCNEDERFQIKAQWGTKQENGDLMQFGNLGDFIAQDPNNPDDVWIIARKIFLATYEWI